MSRSIFNVKVKRAGLNIYIKQIFVDQEENVKRMTVQINTHKITFADLRLNMEYAAKIFVFMFINISKICAVYKKNAKRIIVKVCIHNKFYVKMSQNINFA